MIKGLIAVKNEDGTTAQLRFESNESWEAYDAENNDKMADFDGGEPFEVMFLYPNGKIFRWATVGWEHD